MIMTELEKALLLPGREEEAISERQRRVGLLSVLSVRGVTVVLLSVVLMVILILYVQLGVLQSDHALTLLPSPHPGGAGVGWHRNIHGEYRLVSSTTNQGYNFSEAAAVCQSLHSHLPFIENKDEETELVVS